MLDVLFGLGMTHWSLHFVFLFALSFSALPGCDRMGSKHHAVEPMLEFTFSQLETAEDVQHAVDEATSHSEAIFLVHVDWAPMNLQRQRFAEFQRDYKARYPKSGLAFRYIDCTPVTQGYIPLRALPGWKQLEELKNGASLVHGYGELVWYKNGRVLHVENPLNFDSLDELIAKTESLGMGAIVE
ncbi:hypothetical protein [Gimesia panareensis]|uniref:hypothetical protein n=1 Tax=Gimesia panareensis TaxID=2527978 RepID=UPI0011A37AC6|nr:hypothetical protein [Gimesia panareensis]